MNTDNRNTDDRNSDDKQETDFGGEDPDELLKVVDEKKEEYFRKVAKISLTRDIEPELLARTSFLFRKGTMTIQRIEYNNKKNYFIKNGELKAYCRETSAQTVARQESDNKLSAV